MPPVKAEDLVVHAVKEQFAGLDYCITSPPPWSTLLQLCLPPFGSVRFALDCHRPTRTD
jgi:hypothetical protein